MNIQTHFTRTEGTPCSEPYEYKECGLQGIFLQSGFECEIRDGEEYVSVHDTEGLHRAIGLHLAQNRKFLAPEELLFLRKSMDMTQSELGRYIGQSPQQVARWEKGQSKINGPADRCIRAFFLWNHMGPNNGEDFLNLCKQIDDMDDLTPHRVMLDLVNDQWRDRRRA
ncbi:helix-turn-helix domain-containing protein [Erythrobacter sp. WH158]|uniref:Helix-turn-helix domain-containing protein n=2 Tax=Erythrobacter crassostreae TaxID=2828328 RepID=A0A9X1F3J9_9SPHN|nr:helix-turn-helix domain-containing protein [Erythrobacter crassostrea]